MSSAPPLPDPLDAAKAALRSTMLARRDALPPEQRAAAAAELAARPLPVPLPDHAVVSGYVPIRSEINPLPLLRQFEAAGARLALPAVLGRGQPLAMRAWRFADPLVPGRFGTREPAADAAAVDPDVLLVPLACFDRRGQRIGYGAGYYDRTLARLRALKPVVAIGIAFAAQETAAVPATGWDAPLDLVLTEAEVIDFR